MKKLLIGLILVMVLFAFTGCNLGLIPASSTKVLVEDNNFLEIVSMQEIQVEGYKDDTVIIKCKDKENGNIIYLMQGYRKGGISVIKDSN